MKRKMIPVLTLLALGVTGCTTIPTGPSRMALPGSGKEYWSPSEKTGGHSCPT